MTSLSIVNSSSPLNPTPPESRLQGHDLLSLQLLPNSLSALVAEVIRTKKITAADRYGLMAALTDPTVDPEERYWIDRFRWAVQRGQLEIVDD